MIFDFLSRFVRPSASKKTSRKAGKVNHRSLCFEPLESRELLAVTTPEFDAIRSQYADLNLSANMADYNVIEITAAELSVAKLKAAITEAGTSTKSDLIVLRTTATQNKITYASSADEISININATSRGSVTIVSLGTSPLTIDAAQKTRGLSITSSTVAIAGLTITGGQITSYGAGIYISGTNSTLTITNGTISGNNASSGGGIYNYSGTLTVTNSTISGNTASFSSYYSSYGGGVYSTGTLTVTNCTISGNTASSYGGGIYGSGTFTLKDSIVALNYSKDHDANIRGTLSAASSNNFIDYNPWFVSGPIFDKYGNLTNASTLDLNLSQYSPTAAVGKGSLLYSGPSNQPLPVDYSVVTTLDDEFDLTNNIVSLREAIYAAREYTVITFASNLSGSILLNTQLLIDKGVKIDGAPA